MILKYIINGSLASLYLSRDLLQVVSLEKIINTKEKDILNLENVIEIQTTKKFEDSSIAKILQMVQDAASRKAPTELFIRKFAKIYTPIVFFLAAAL